MNDLATGILLEFPVLGTSFQLSLAWQASINLQGTIPSLPCLRHIPDPLMESVAKPALNYCLYNNNQNNGLKIFQTKELPRALTENSHPQIPSRKQFLEALPESVF